MVSLYLKGRSGFEIKPLGPITLGKDGRDAEGAQLTHTNTPQEHHQKRPHEGTPPSLHNDRRWRDDAAYHPTV